MLLTLAVLLLSACNLRLQPIADVLPDAGLPAAPTPDPAPSPEPPAPETEAPQPEAPVPPPPPAADPPPPPPPPPPPAPAPAPAGVDAGIAAMEQQMVDLVNAERAAAGLPAFTVSDGLTGASRAWSEEMAASGNFRHDDIQVPPGFRTAGENIAFGTDRPGIVEVLHDGLMNSPGHRANILNGDFTDLGIGFAVDGGDVYVTQRFAG